ncbi:hypothetical protein THOM_2989, partial [Trachipleistophora hominis]
VADMQENDKEFQERKEEQIGKELPTGDKSTNINGQSVDFEDGNRLVERAYNDVNEDLVDKVISGNRGDKFDSNRELHVVIHDDDLKNFDKLSPDKMLSILNTLIAQLSDDNVHQIYAFLLNLQEHTLKIPSTHHESIKSSITTLSTNVMHFLPVEIEHYGLRLISVIDDTSERKVPFSTYLTNFLTSLLIKLTIKEIENAVNNYFYPEKRKIECGIEDIIENGFGALLAEEEDDNKNNDAHDEGKEDVKNELKSFDRTGTNENGDAYSTRRGNHEITENGRSVSGGSGKRVLQVERTNQRLYNEKGSNIDEISAKRMKYNATNGENVTNNNEKMMVKEVLLSNKTLFYILKDEDYNINLFLSLLGYEEKLQSFLLFLYINHENTYELFLKNVLSSCTAEQQPKILKNFIEVRVQDLKFFDKENLKEMVKKRMAKESLKLKLKEMEKGELLEIIKEDFKFFKNDLDYYDFSFKELLTLAEERDEIVEHLFDNLASYGTNWMGSVMKVLSGKNETFVLNFFQRRVRLLEDKTRANKEEEVHSLLYDAIVVYLKYNKPSKPLLQLFRSNCLLDNRKYFLNVITILEKETIKNRLMDYLDDETLPFFTRVITANEILYELCVFNCERYDREKGVKNGTKDRLEGIFKSIIPKFTEDTIIQTLASSDNTQNFFLALKYSLAAYVTLKPFTLTVLQRHSLRTSEYVDVLEMMGMDAIDVLVCKDKSFISYVLRRSKKIKDICARSKDRKLRGIEKVLEVYSNQVQ